MRQIAMQQQRNAPAATGGSASGSRGVRITLNDISHAFLSGEQVVRAVDQVSLTISSGQFACIVGPSGCGKTTLLSMISGLVMPEAGRVEIDGTVVSGPRPDVAYMFARDALMPWRTALQNAELRLEVQGIPRRERRERAQEWLARVGLADFANLRISSLSQGMRQRVAIARTLVGEPTCILMDEPFAALDAQTRILMRQEFLTLVREVGATVVFVTHDLEEALLLGDRVVVMSRRPARIVADMEFPELAGHREVRAIDDAFTGQLARLQQVLTKEVMGAQ